MMSKKDRVKTEGVFLHRVNRRSRGIPSREILAVDPGVSTGISRWIEYSGGKVRVDVAEIRCDTNKYDSNDARGYLPVTDLLDLELNIMAGAHPSRNCTVVCEEFTITGRTLKTKLERASLIIRDWLAIECARRGIPFVLQTAVKGKTLNSMEVVKAIDPGLWVPGHIDSHDSSRHIVAYLREHPTPAFKERLNEYGLKKDREWNNGT